MAAPYYTDFSNKNINYLTDECYTIKQSDTEVGVWAHALTGDF